MSGGYGFVKSLRVVAVLRSLEVSTEKIKISPGGKHNLKVKPVYASDRSFPLPVNHREMNKFIVQKLAEKLEEWDVCSCDEFLNRL